MLKLELRTGGSAFCDPHTGEENELSKEIEVARLLRKVKNEILSGRRSGSMMDSNGNKVGTWSMD